MYLQLPHREQELFGDEPREPQDWAGWPARAVVGDRIHIRERGANLRYPAGTKLEGPNGEQAVVVAVHSGSAMFWGSAVAEVLALPLEAEVAPYEATRLTPVGE